MRFLGPTRYPRLNEGVGLVLLALGIALTCSLVSYYPHDPSWNTATSNVRPLNLIGRAGAHASDALLQLAGLGAFTIPALLMMLAWKWFRSDPIEAQLFKVAGAIALVVGVCTAFSLGPQWRPFGGTISAGGLIGNLAADYLDSQLNPLGAVLLTVSVLILSLYVVSTFSLRLFSKWFAGPIALLGRLWIRFQSWREIRRHKRREQAVRKKERKVRRQPAAVADAAKEPISEVLPGSASAARLPDDLPPWTVDTTVGGGAPAFEPEPDEIPIHALEDYMPSEAPLPVPVPAPVDATPVQRRPAKKEKSCLPTTLRS
jgi:DNA segregation ATPase FtsK/SpoIIIE, S-DNA-T family